MNTIKIKILFLIAKSRLNQMGKCSIRCRITYKQKLVKKRVYPKPVSRVAVEENVNKVVDIFGNIAN